MEHTKAVKEYYEANTTRFLKWGKDQGTYNIHGALWPPEVSNLAEAMHFSNELISREIQNSRLAVKTVLDLGCGAGSSLFYLGGKHPELLHLRGISLSEKQISIAIEKAGRLGSDRYQFEVSDFQDLPEEIDHSELAFAIEAFAHAEYPDRFFRQAAKVLIPGGKLVLIDDFLADGKEEDKLSPSQNRLLDTYRKHWLLKSLLPVAEIIRLADSAGLRFSRELDLTSWLRLRRPRDRFIALLLPFLFPFFRFSYYWRSLKGGDARQRCLRKGLVHYRMMVFQKSPGR